VIREAQPGDAADLLRLIRGLAEYEREPAAVETTEDALRSALAATEPRVHAHVAEVDGRIVGMALWFLTYSTWTGTPTLYMEDLFVEPGLRRGGVGRELMAALAAEAEGRGCARMEWSVLEWNEPAIAFYRSFGANPLTEWRTWRMNLAESSDAQDAS
jgi:GNAT superfamily N-acetyltransferase